MKTTVMLLHEDHRFFAFATLEQLNGGYRCVAENPLIEEYGSTAAEAFSRAQTQFCVIVDEAVKTRE